MPILLTIIYRLFFCVSVCAFISLFSLSYAEDLPAAASTSTAPVNSIEVLPADLLLQHNLKRIPRRKLALIAKTSTDSDVDSACNKISLSVQKIAVKILLQLIAQASNTNVIISDKVAGEMAINLNEMDCNQALEMVLHEQKLSATQKNGITYIAPLSSATDLPIGKNTDDVLPNNAAATSEIIQVNYAKASELSALIKNVDNSFLSAHGRISVDERTNSLLLFDTADRIAAVRALLTKLDIPVRQVLIESRIVIARDDFSRELGAKFGLNAALPLAGSGLATTSGSTMGANAIIQNAPAAISGISNSVNNIDNRLNYNVPASPTAGRIAFALLGSEHLLDLELSALETQGRGEVISSPRIITANARQSSIEQGLEIPYQQINGNGATSMQFKKAVLSLKVLPQITPDGKIILDLEINKDSKGMDVHTGNGGTAPSIDTRKINTQVLVNNGQTIVLGGIYEHIVSNAVSKVPLLGDIPVLGNLFKTRINQSSKAELLVFVTPKIISEDPVTH